MRFTAFVGIPQSQTLCLRRPTPECAKWRPVASQIGLLDAWTGPAWGTGRVAPFVLSPSKMRYNRLVRAGSQRGFDGDFACVLARTGQGTGLTSEAHQPNCHDHGGTARAGVPGRLRRGAHPHPERARRLQHDCRAPVLQGGPQKRQIGFILSRSPESNLRELAVPPPGLQALLVPPQAYAPAHRYVSAGHSSECRYGVRAMERDPKKGLAEAISVPQHAGRGSSLGMKRQLKPDMGKRTHRAPTLHRIKRRIVILTSGSMTK